MNKLHIVSFDVPYPPDYGGAIDVYHKIKALSEQGVHIYLHCFAYGRNKSPELNTLCREVFYYPRKTRWESLPLTLPHIVASRQNEQLLQNLLANQAPILFEGLHTCFYLSHPQLQNRVKIVRTHNIEHDYYRYLSRVETNLLKRFYYYLEARQLFRYESILQHAQHIAAISAADTQYLQAKYGNKVQHIPAFHGNLQLNALSGRGNYAFYHGNLSVGENYRAAQFLIKEVFAQLPFQLTIAGKNPPPELQMLISQQSNCLLYPNPSAAQMQQLMQEAQVHVLPTFQPTGIKLKLLNSLSTGRFCVVNPLMVSGTGLENLCHIAHTPQEFRRIISTLFEQTFTETHLAKRRQALLALFSDEENVKKITSLIFAE